MNKKAISVRLSPGIIDMIKEMAARQGLTMTFIIEYAIKKIYEESKE